MGRVQQSTIALDTRVAWEYFCELPRVTVRVHLEAMRGYVRPRDRRPLSVNSQDSPNVPMSLPQSFSPAWPDVCLRVERAMGIEPTGNVLREAQRLTAPASRIETSHTTKIGTDVECLNQRFIAKRQPRCRFLILSPRGVPAK
jgi:hypothetical protein